MFLHNFKYELLAVIRQKEVLFWMICFPLVLGLFFHIAFSNIYEKTQKFSTISAAVVENQKNETFNEVIKAVSNGDEALFDIEYLSKDQALKKLEAEDITVIFNVDKDISLSVSDSGIEQTIAKSFLKQYKIEEKIITDSIKENPLNAEKVITAFSKEINSNTDLKISDGNMDAMIQYFYNLIAMVCLMGSVIGLDIAIRNQGNLSAIGMRKCCSPTHKLKSITACLAANYLMQIICVSLCITFLRFVLGVDFGNKLGMVYLSGIIGGITGTSLGFFIGSIGRASSAVKNAIAMTISLGGCFLSGLMVGNMKPLIEQHVPIINRINPAALISDTFYCLNIYDDYKRYTINIISLIILTGIFIIGGFLFTRRKKYASL